ncbi:MAG: RsmG family class I SAM-dependent methyltransferase [Acidimicrobiales bacterium]
MGFLGPGPLRVHINHARYYLDSILDDTTRLVDLGSGGGLPGLPLLLDLPAVEGRLVDGSEKRCQS